MSPSTRVIINLDVPEATISRHLYGHFAEHLGRCVYGGFWVGEDAAVPHVRGIRADVVEALRGLDIPNLRWPGGCFADEYHWRDGVGPRKERPRMVNTHWGNVVEDNSFGTHEFFDLCELLGAEPYVAGNIGSGTVREMSDWVEYLTRHGDSPMASLRREHGRDEPWRVPFWGIGNEPWGCGGAMTAEHYANEARRYATYCRDHGDNKLYRIAAGASDDDVKWTKALMEAAGCISCSGNTIYQAISFHYYTHVGGLGTGDATVFGLDEYYAAISKAQDVERIIRAHSTVMDAYDPKKRIGLVLDEWGTWWKPAEGTNPAFLHQQNTLRDALVAAVHFDAFHRHADRLVMANIAQTVNVLQAMILTDEQSGVLTLTPTYHVFAMNKGHQDAAALLTRIVDAPPGRTAGDHPLELVSASASAKDGRALVSLSNIDAESSLDVVLDLRGGRVSELTGRLLAAGTATAHNTPEAPDAVAPRPFEVRADERGARVTLPPHSFATVAMRVD
jgi:alpha-L-arabinofuranosidase